MTEYRVLTECGRNLHWSTTDRCRLDRELKEGGYIPVEIQLFSEYEADIEAQYQQLALNHELEKVVEEETAA